MMPLSPYLRNFFSSCAHAVHEVCSVVVPPTCFMCDQLVQVKRGMGVCPECWGTLPFWSKIDNPEPLLDDEIDSLQAPLLYEGVVKEAIHSFKFADKVEYAPIFSRLMHPQLSKIEGALLLPVPLHARRLWHRQYNQAALLVTELAAQTDMSYNLFALKRVKHTEHQTGKTKKQRQKMMASAFAVDAEKVAGKTVVLVDDIWTTGSTAKACAKVLKAAGAKEVHVLTLAYVPL